MRILVDIFGQTLRTLWAHKLRSFLTMFGIAWVWDRCYCSPVWRRLPHRQPTPTRNLRQKHHLLFGGRAPAVEAASSP